MAVNDRNQINTDRSTCTTSAVWKKSIHGMKFETVGVLESTNSKEKMPEASSDKTPRKNQPFEILIWDGVNWSRCNELKGIFSVV